MHQRLLRTPAFDTQGRAIGLDCLAMALVTALACSGSTPTATSASSALNPLQQQGAVTVSMVAPTHVGARDTVAFHIVLKNVSSTPLTVDLAGYPQRTYFDVVVTRSTGEPVWHFLKPGEVMVRSLRRVLLAAGDTLDFSATWDVHDDAGAAVPPGVYGVRGRLLAPPADLMTEVRTFTVIP